jgi:hypothetical protein
MVLIYILRFGVLGYTEISLVPDLNHLISSSNGPKHARKEIDAGNLAALHRRVVDVAGCLASRGVKVKLNDHLIRLSSFKDYAMLFMKPLDDDGGSVDSPSRSKQCYYEQQGLWEVAMISSSSFTAHHFNENDSDTDTQSEKAVSGSHISFVNAVHTSKVNKNHHRNSSECQ